MRSEVQLFLGPPQTEGGGQRSEIRGQKDWFRFLASDIRSLEAEGRGQEAEVEEGSSDIWFLTSELCNGGVAQLGERLPCTQEVIGSIPFTSTKESFKCYVLSFR